MVHILLCDQQNKSGTDQAAEHSEGLLRIRGRHSKAPLNYNAKHPLILHRSREITRMLIEKEQHNSGHQGLEHERSPATEIPDDCIAKSAEKSREILYHFQTREGRQPDTRDGWSAEFKFPDANKCYYFVDSGIDIFSIFYIEDNRQGTRHTQYVCLFTCLGTTAVYLESL